MTGYSFEIFVRARHKSLASVPPDPSKNVICHLLHASQRCVPCDPYFRDS